MADAFAFVFFSRDNLFFKIGESKDSDFIFLNRIQTGGGIFGSLDENVK